MVNVRLLLLSATIGGRQLLHFPTTTVSCLTEKRVIPDKTYVPVADLTMT